MKKVSILSMQKVDNFGSLLQSYSLKKIVEKLGNEVAFIDIEPKLEDDKLMKRRIITAEEIQANKSKLKKLDLYAINRIRIKIKDNKQKSIFEDFRKNYLKINSLDNDKQYDVCIIGSDEVFNCCANSRWGFTSQLFGNVKNAKTVITYAASCGSTKIDSLNIEVAKKIKNCFKNVKSISVRDKNTYNFVKALSDKKIIINLDPVLVGSFDEEINSNNNVKLPKRYCILYSYYNRFNKKEEIDYIKQFCKKNNLELITIGAPQFWIRKHLVLNPFEMLYAFKKADFVITDTFHGTIFASKYSKKFSVIIRESNKQKLGDLINRTKKEKHLCYELKDIDNIYRIDNDINETNEICKNERKKSIEYLKNNL